MAAAREQPLVCLTAWMTSRIGTQGPCPVARRCADRVGGEFAGACGPLDRPGAARLMLPYLPFDVRDMWWIAAVARRSLETFGQCPNVSSFVPPSGPRRLLGRVERDLLYHCVPPGAPPDGRPVVEKEIRGSSGPTRRLPRPSARSAGSRPARGRSCRSLPRSPRCRSARSPGSRAALRHRRARRRPRWSGPPSRYSR